jgi:hypothetical protein
VPQDFLYVPDRAPVEQQLRSGCVTKQVRGHALRQACKPAVVGERPPDIISSEPGSATLCNEQSWMIVMADRKVSAEPVERAFGKKHRALFVTLADDAGFPFGKVYVAPVQR